MNTPTDLHGTMWGARCSNLQYGEKQRGPWPYVNNFMYLLRSTHYCIPSKERGVYCCLLSTWAVWKNAEYQLKGSLTAFPGTQSVRGV